jgi:hypothetical protein
MLIRTLTIAKYKFTTFIFLKTHLSTLKYYKIIYFLFLYCFFPQTPSTTLADSPASNNPSHLWRQPIPTVKKSKPMPQPRIPRWQALTHPR